jgi:hypothetical protein
MVKMTIQNILYLKEYINLDLDNIQLIKKVFFMKLQISGRIFNKAIITNQDYIDIFNKYKDNEHAL